MENALGSDTLVKSLKVLKPGGNLISISGPPDQAFARAQGLNWGLWQVLRLMSASIRRKAERQGIDYAFLFMRASGGELEQIGTLFEQGRIRPVIDRVVPFAELAGGFS